MAHSINLTDLKTRAAVRSETLLQQSSRPLIGLGREGITEELRHLGVPEKQLRMRVNQIWHWLYIRGVSDFADMKNLSKDFRKLLADNFDISRPKIVEEQDRKSVV